MILITAIGLTAQAVGTTSTYQALLSAVPAAPERAIQVWLNDYRAAAHDLGFDPPGPEATADEILSYLLALDRGGVPAGPFLSGFHSYARVVLPDLQERSGYDVRDVRASLQDLASIPGRCAVVLLDVPVDDVRGALLTTSAWPPPKELEHTGVPLLVWDPVFRPDLGRRLIAPVFDELGRAAPLAFSQEAILSGSSVEKTEAMIDAQLAAVPSLWDVEGIRRLADGLARLGTYSSVLTNDPSSQSVGSWMAGYATLPPSEQARALDEGNVEEALRPYEALGLGVGTDEAGLYLAIALLHADGSAANENVARLTARLKNGRSLAQDAPWSTWFDVESIATTAEDSLLLARIPLLATAPASIWVRWFIARDPLLLFREG